MSQAHPMIQPSGWGESDQPDVVEKNQPFERAALYRVIWHTSLACAMKPPLLRHTRTVWRGAGGTIIAAAGLKPVEGQEGYWLERQDFPRPSWPVNQAMPSAFAHAEVISASVRRRPAGPTPGALIQGISDAQISTPASLQGLLGQLIGESGKSTALVVFAGQGLDRWVEMTADGKERLRLWKSAGLVGQIATRNRLVDEVDQGETSSRDALHQIAGHHQRLQATADVVARQIDALCAQWQGMSRDDLMREEALRAQQPPVHKLLPAWMDPESQLPADHPLREWRKEMEADLALNDPTWSLLEPQQRARRRLGWLQDHASEIGQGGGPEFAAAMDAETGQFSALRFWLTGLSTGPGSIAR